MALEPRRDGGSSALVPLRTLVLSLADPTKIFSVLILIVLAAIVPDHYSRLTRMGWVPHVKQIRRGHSPLDPVGAALGEPGRAEAPFRIFASLFDGAGKGSELLFKPIAAALRAVAGSSQLVFTPIAAVLGLVAGARRS